MTASAKSAVVGISEGVRRVPQMFKNPFRLGGLRIGPRLTVCFVAIVLSMMAADVVAVWQFNRTTAPARHLNEADRTSLAVVRVHLDVDTFRDSMAALASTHDIRQFRNEAASLRQKFVEDVAQSQQLLASSRDTVQDPAIRSALETLRVTLPSQLDASAELASAGDWTAVSLRVADQVQALIDLSSSLVEKVDRKVSQERAEAIESAQRAHRQLLLVLPVAALLPLLVAVALGSYATRSMTEPLSELDAGTRALARGDFHHQVAIQGEDELARLGQVFNDTARRLAVLYETLRNNEARFRLVIDTIPGYVWSAQPDGSLDFINRRWLDFSGMSLEDGLGQGWEAAVHPDDVARFADEWRTAVACGKAMESEARVRRADGQYRWLLIRNVPLHDQGGKIVKWYGTSTDIDDRKRAEETLREQANLLDLTHDAIFAADMGGVIKYWNRGAEERYGWTAEQAVGRDVHDLLKTLFSAPLEQIKAEVIRTGRWEGELVHTRKDGSPVVVASRWSLQRTGQGAPFAILETNNDITERKRAEEALRRSEAYLAEGQRLSHTGSWALDVASDKYAYCSEECLRIYGFDPQEGLPTREAVFRRIHAEDRNRVEATFEKALREKVDSSDELRIALPDGTVKCVHVTRHPVLNDAGDVVTVIGTSIDITERKRAEEALRQSNAYNRSLIEANVDPLVTIGPDGKITDVNAATEAATGRCRGELVGTDFCDYFTEPAKARAGYEQVFREGTVRDYPLELRHRGGGVMSVLYNASVYRDESGRVIGVFAAARDITERKRTEEALRGSETRFRTFVDHAADALFIHDFEQGTTVDVNRQACESLGYTRQELIGATALAFHLDSDRALMESVAQRAAAGETVIDTHWHRRKDGSLFPVEAHTSQYWYGGRRFLLKVARDISDRLRAEEEREKLRQLQADLAHVNRVTTMGELTASLAHELNQPITAVITSAKACLRWLNRDIPELERARAAALRIEKDGTRAAETISRLRAFYKKGAPPEPELLDVNEVAREMLELLQSEATKFSIAMRADLAAELPKVKADRVQLQQVFMNLMLNGIEAMKETSGELTIKSQLSQQGEVLISVSDTGVGLPAEKADQIFKAFFTTKEQGTGMGLAISRSIIESHGGRLWARADGGRGATFHFTLPTEREVQA